MDRSKQNLFNMLSLVGIMVVVFLAVGLSVLLGWKNSFAPARTLTVTAQGMAIATPDEGDISFSVVSQGANPQALSNDNNAKMSAVIQFVASQGVASSDIATTGYNLQPDYSYNTIVNEGDGVAIPVQQSPKIIGYTLTQTVQVKIKDLTKVASVLGGLAPLGVNDISNVNFTFQNPDEFVSQARVDALSKARIEAAQMASEAGASVGGVVTVTESSNVPYPQPGVYAMNAGASGAMAAVAPTVEPGTQNVTDEVTVTYQLQ